MARPGRARAAKRPCFTTRKASPRAGFVVTSYSAIRRARPEVEADERSDADGGAAESSAVDETVASPPRPDELPRGRLSGTFLHDIIEHLPLDTLGRAPSFEE